MDTPARFFGSLNPGAALRRGAWLAGLLLSVWSAGAQAQDFPDAFEAQGVEEAPEAEEPEDSGETGRFVRGRAEAAPGAATGRTQRQARVQIDEATRSVFITTDTATHDQIMQVLQALDRPVPQALIKVLFLEVTHTDDLDIGADIRYNHTNGNGDTTDIASVFGAALQPRGGVATILENDLEVTLAALSEVGTLNVLSRPSILARNSEEATITIGQEVPFVRNTRVTESGQTINTVEYEDIGIILTVTPHIGADGMIELDVAPEISTITGDTVPISDTVDAQVFAKRSAQTKVIVPSGRTVVIGGLMEDLETTTLRKVPLLGDIPWLGALFRRNEVSKSKTELLIFLTPTLVESGASLTALSAAEKDAHGLMRQQATPEQLRRYFGDDQEATDTEPAP